MVGACQVLTKCKVIKWRRYEWHDDCSAAAADQRMCDGSAGADSLRGVGSVETRGKGVCSNAGTDECIPGATAQVAAKGSDCGGRWVVHGYDAMSS